MSNDVENNPASDTDKDHPEERCRDSFAQSFWPIPATALIITPPPMTSVSLAVLLVALVRKDQSVFDSTASF